MRIFLLSCFVVLGLLAAGCSATEEVPLQEEPLPDPEDVVSAVGIMRYVDLEGGFYGLVVNDTARYQPTNLDSTYRQDGLRVRFRGVLVDSLATVQMWGRPLEIRDIVQVDF